MDPCQAQVSYVYLPPYYEFQPYDPRSLYIYINELLSPQEERHSSDFVKNMVKEVVSE